jgi:hypothetical protein
MSDTERERLAEAAWRHWGPYLSERQLGTVREDNGDGPWSSFTHEQAQAAFPYADLVAINGSRDRTQPEYELLDTGVFDGDRYFDIEVEYAKATPEDLLMRSPRTTPDRTTPSCTCCPRCGSGTPGPGPAATSGRCCAWRMS